MRFSRPVLAYTLPFLVFLAGLGLVALVESFGKGSDSLLLREPRYWLFPLQTIACAIIIAIFWKEYEFKNRGGVFWGIGAGLVVLAVWVSPQLLFGQPARVDGFNPDIITDPTLYWLTVVGRFVRLALVVPILEELFWRGFLMRYLIKEDFQKVPLGAYSPLSFFGVAVLFMFEHGTADWPAALFTGLLWGYLMIRTKSLVACIVAHAVANFGLGLFVMATKQWGFW